MPFPWSLPLTTLLVLLFLTAACSREPEAYPPPPQRAPITGTDVLPLGQFIEMSDPKAELYLERDINKTLEGGTWRWTYEHPQFRFFLRRTEGLRFVMDFSIIESTFRQTGPLTVSVSVNGHPLGSVKCEKPGDYRFDHPVPSAWLRTGEPTTVDAQADKLWTSPADGVRLGYTVARAGFL